MKVSQLTTPNIIKVEIADSMHELDWQLSSWKSDVQPEVLGI